MMTKEGVRSQVLRLVRKSGSLEVRTLREVSVDSRAPDWREIYEESADSRAPDLEGNLRRVRGFHLTQDSPNAYFKGPRRR